jgi:hypothetical protein
VASYSWISFGSQRRSEPMRAPLSRNMTPSLFFFAVTIENGANELFATGVGHEKQAVA